MNQIVANFQPFSLNQNITVYSDGDIIESVDTDIDNIVNIVKGLKNKYNVQEINLVGNTNYLSKFQKDLSTDFDIAKINIIQR